jgi:hypothetical protein
MEREYLVLLNVTKANAKIDVPIPRAMLFRGMSTATPPRSTNAFPCSHNGEGRKVTMALGCGTS